MPDEIKPAPANSQDTAQFASLLRAPSHAGLLIVDEQARVLHADAGATRAFGTTALPTSLRELIGQAFSNGETQRTPLALSGQQNMVADARHVELNGQRLVLVWLQAAGVVPGSESRIEQLDRLATLGALSASIGHDIRNRLVAMRTFLHVLLERHPNEELARLAQQELRRTEAALATLLGFSAHTKHVVKPVRLHSMIAQLSPFIRRNCDDQGVTVQTALDARNDTVTGDEVELQQAILNLLFNGIEAMASGGTLTISTHSTADTLILRIADTGSGIPAENLKTIFEPFFTTKAEGTGLGLAICRRIVEAHDGKITVRSEPGSGTEFSVALPLAADLKPA